MVAWDSLNFHLEKLILPSLTLTTCGRGEIKHSHDTAFAISEMVLC